MASSITNGVSSVASSLKAGLTENKKIADLQTNIKDAHSKHNNTTDHGVTIEDLDHWLKNVNTETGRVGSAYLEDQIARERVGTAMCHVVQPLTSSDPQVRPRTHS